jgi:hypothetical protein
MATRRTLVSLSLCTLLAAGGYLPGPRPTVCAAETSGAYEADAKQAMVLYRQGQYEEAATIFARLSVEYPDMLVFGRNLGACYYYLRKPEPALSNLRSYLDKTPGVDPEDKARIERWIAEMEELQRQNAAAEMQRAAQAAAAATVPLDGGVAVVTMAPAESPPPAEKPIYARWWFWTAVGVVAAGSVTAFLLANQPAAQSRCPAGGLPCDSIK